jgi:hypothetical protein
MDLDLKRINISYKMFEESHFLRDCFDNTNYYKNEKKFYIFDSVVQNTKELLETIKSSLDFQECFFTLEKDIIAILDQKYRV